MKKKRMNLLLVTAMFFSMFVLNGQKVKATTDVPSENIVTVSSEAELRSAIENASSSEKTIIEIDASADIVLSNQAISIENKEDIVIRMSEEGAPHALIQTNGNVRHFEITRSNVTFENIRLSGDITNKAGGIATRADSGNQKFLILEKGTVIENCAIGNNGGAVSADTMHVTVHEGVVIRGNVAHNDGAGIYINNGDLVIHGGLFENNTSSNRGGAVCSYNGNLTVYNGTFANNNAINRAGAIFFSGREDLGKRATIYAGEFTGNKLTNSGYGYGGAIYVESLSYMIIYNAYVTGNEAQNGGGIFGCPTGTIITYDHLAAATFDNTASVSGDDFFASHKSANNGAYTTLVKNILGGGTVTWYEDTSANRRSSNVVEGITNQVTHIALKASISEEDKIYARDAATTIFTGNVSGNYGGGVATNGKVEFGSRIQETEATITATKTYNDLDYTGTEYSFVLKREDGGVVETVSSVQDGLVQFEAIVFPEAGTYTFTVSEVIGSDDAIVYDETIYTVVIEVVEDVQSNSLVVASKTITSEGAVVGDIVFNNYPFDTAAVVNVDITKTLDGAIPTDGVFFFDLIEVVNGQEGSEPIETVSTVNGRIKFTKLRFEEAGVYVYKIRESKGDDRGIKYSDDVYTITITVTEGANEIMSADVKIEKDGDTSGNQLGYIAFENYTVPYIGTTASEVGTDSKSPLAEGEITIKDVVEYHNLTIGDEYTLTGTLMIKNADGETGEVLKDDAGNPITATITWTADATDGEKGLEFTFDASLLKGKTVVAFEKLTSNGIEVAVHEDIKDENQSIFFPKLSTKARDNESGTSVAEPKEEVTIIDTVEYENLIVGNTYELHGTLMIKNDDGETGTPYMVDDAVYEVVQTFTPTSPNGTVELAFTIDASELKGKQVVVFEDLYLDQVKVGAHADIKDEGQTIRFEFIRISTTAKGKDSGNNTIEAKNPVTVIDTVSYENLEVGKEYTVKGVLMDKDSNEPLLVNGEEVRAEKTFTPTESNGSIDLEFTFDAKDLKGKTIVVFEYLYQDGREVAVHTDINDAAQTVVVREKTPDTGDSMMDSAIIISLLGMVSLAGVAIIARKKKSIN